MMDAFDFREWQKGRSNELQPLDWILRYVFAIQVMIALFLVVTFSLKNNRRIMPLETAVDAVKKNSAVNRAYTRGDFLDTVVIMSGSRIKQGLDIGEDSAVIDEGLSVQLLLQERPSAGCGLLKSVRLALDEDEFERFKQKLLRDDVLNIYYGGGESERKFLKNRAAIDRTFQRYAPVLPWKKKPDIIVLPNFFQDNLGGVLHMVNENPDMVVLCPRFDREDFARMHHLTDNISGLVSLPEGYTRLTRRLSALVTRTAPSSGKPYYQLMLIIEGHSGLTVVSGINNVDLQEQLRMVSSKVPAGITTFVGATNLFDSEVNPRTKKKLQELRKKYPGLTIHPNIGTSPAARKMLVETFKDGYSSTFIGQRIEIPGKKDRN